MHVVSVTRQTRPGFAGLPDREGFDAVVESDGVTVHLSKLDGEDRWYADAVFGANGMPYFVHGFGDRTVLKRSATHDMTVLLDEAAAEGVSV